MSPLTDCYIEYDFEYRGSGSGDLGRMRFNHKSPLDLSAPKYYAEVGLTADGSFFGRGHTVNGTGGSSTSTPGVPGTIVAKLGGTVVNDATPGGQAWTNAAGVLNGATGSGQDQATNGLNVVSNNGVSQYLKVTNFGFAVPTGATITGVTVTINRKQTVAEAMHDYTLKLVVGGAIVGSNKAIATNWKTAYETIAYGGTSDKWGTTLTAAQINASNFGLVFNAQNTSGSSSVAAVNWIKIQIDYTTGGSTEQPGAQPSFTGGSVSPNTRYTIQAHYSYKGKVSGKDSWQLDMQVNGASIGTLTLSDTAAAGDGDTTKLSSVAFIGLDGPHGIEQYVYGYKVGTTGYGSTDIMAADYGSGTQDTLTDWSTIAQTGDGSISIVAVGDETKPPDGQIIGITASSWARQTVLDNTNTTEFVGVMTLSDNSVIVAFIEGASASSKGTLASKWAITYYRCTDATAATPVWALWRREGFNAPNTNALSANTLAVGSVPSAYYPQAHAVGADGRLIRRVNTEDLTGSPGGGECEYLIGAGGSNTATNLAAATWVKASGSDRYFGADPATTTVQVSRIIKRSDGKLMAFGEQWPYAAGTRTDTTKVSNKILGQRPFIAIGTSNGTGWVPCISGTISAANLFYPNEPSAVELANGDWLMIWRSGTLPWTDGATALSTRSSQYNQVKITKTAGADTYTFGTPKKAAFSTAITPIHPELVKDPQSGAIIFVSQSPEGYWYTIDEGATWTQLANTTETGYYPRSTLLTNNQIASFSHQGGDYDFGGGATQIYFDRFTVTAVRQVDPGDVDPGSGIFYYVDKDGRNASGVKGSDTAWSNVERQNNPAKPFASINAAVAAVGNGDRIVVRQSAASYTGTTFANRTFTAKPYVSAYTGETPQIFGMTLTSVTNFRFEGITFTDTVRGTKWDGLEFSKCSGITPDPNSKSHSGNFYVNGYSNCLFEDLDLVYSGPTTNLTGAIVGFNTSNGGKNNTWRRMRIHGFPGDAFNGGNSVGYNENWLIENCTWSNVRKPGLTLNPDGTPRQPPHVDAVQISGGSDGITFRNNIIYDGIGRVMWMPHQLARPDGSGGDADGPGGHTNLKIYNNVWYSTTDFSCRLWNCPGVVVAHNTFWGNTNPGNGLDLHASQGLKPPKTMWTLNASVYNNIIGNLTNDATNPATFAVQTKNLLPYNATTASPTDLKPFTPLFVNTNFDSAAKTPPNLRLKSESAGVNQGTTAIASYLAKDADGITRTATPDIGAYEYH
jgi:hypothetical protein